MVKTTARAEEVGGAIRGMGCSLDNLQKVSTCTPMAASSRRTRIHSPAAGMAAAAARVPGMERAEVAGSEGSEPAVATRPAGGRVEHTGCNLRKQ